MNTLSLLPHNEAAYHKAMSHLETHRKVAVVQPCGTGKSYVGGAIASHFKKVLVVAPNDYVLGQAVATTPHADTASYSYLAICNDMPTGYDLIWFDELHRIGAPTWMGGVDRLIEANPDAKILGTTATPERALEQRDMADEFFDGDVVSSMTLTDAWVDHILRVPKYVIGVVSMDSTQSDYAERISKSTRINESQKKEATAFLDNIVRDWSYSYGVPRILKKYIDGDVERMIVFAQTIAKLDEVVSSIGPWFNEAGVKLANIYTVHSCMGAEAKRQMSAFENDTTEGVKVLVSVDMLNEGVHVSRVDAVMLLRSTISKNLYIQQIGRCFAVGQKHQPIILDLADNLTSACGYDGIYDAQSRYNSGAASVPSDRTPDEFIVIDTLKETRELISIFCESFFKHVAYTLEECKKIALNYNSRTAWSDGHKSSYQKARRMNWLDECCKHMKAVPVTRTLEECVESASHYTTKAEWERECPAMHSYAYSHGWMDECKKHFKVLVSKHTLDECKEVAMQYKRRVDWQNGDCKTYTYALTHGWIEECCQHMKKIYSSHTKEECLASARRYTTKRDWLANDSALVQYARKRGWMEECCAHMTNLHNKHTKEECLESARHYDTRDAWCEGDHKLYDYACKYGWLEECCQHMKKGRISYTLEMVKEEAKKFHSRKLFKSGSPRYYDAAVRHKWLDLLEFS